MDDNFWESLRQGFMQLRSDCAIDPPLSPAGRLTAIWTAEREKKWRLNYHGGKDGNGVIRRFGWAAESAAARLGFNGTEDEAVSHWLDRIKSNVPASHVKRITMSSGIGEADELYSVEILDICGLSADYCWKGHAEEIRSRASLAAENDATGKSSQRDAYEPAAKTGVTAAPPEPPTEYSSVSDETKVASSSAAVRQEIPQEEFVASDLPALDSDATQRIAEVLKEARAHVSENPNETRVTQAMALYLDSIAWEYARTQSSAAFEALIDGISAKARGEFAGDLAVTEDRKRYWINEAQERAANGIVGRAIPIRVAAHQVQIFHDLELQFRAIPGARGDLQAIFFDETRFNIFSNYPDPTDDILERQKFEVLARQAMATLDFRFADSSRAIFYWLQFLKQRSPHFKQWKCRRLCAASADFCAELKTLARESAPRGTEGENPVGPLPQTVSPGYIPSQQKLSGQPAHITISPGAIPSQQRVGSPIMHVDLSVPLLRHEIIAGPSGPGEPRSGTLRKEIIRLANRIQAAENPELPAAEAGDRWLDRLSIPPRSVWELRDVLTESEEFCTDLAIHLLRSGKRELSADFDTFAARFKALLAEYFPVPISPTVAEELAVAPPSLVGTSPEGRIKSGTSLPLNLKAGPGTTANPAAQARAWEEVEIRFLSDNRVQVTAGVQSEPLTYAEFGFEDGRSKTPILAWVTLRSLAEAGGTIQRTQNGPMGAKLEKRIEKIRTTLRKRFQLETDPVPFIKGVGYRAQFKINCGPSYNS